MKKDISLQAFIELTENVLSSVLNIKINKTEGNVNSRFTLSTFESKAASLCFFGDYDGRIEIIIKNDDLKKITQMIIDDYDIRVSVDDKTVFSEILNMFCGNLVTKLLEEFDIFVSINSPWENTDNDAFYDRLIMTKFVLSNDVALNILYYLK